VNDIAWFLDACGRTVRLLGLLVGSPDFLHLVSWQAATALLGASIYPFVSRVFGSFFDRGWPFARVLALLLLGYLQWLLASLHLIPYSGATQWGLVFLLIGGGAAFFRGEGYGRAFAGRGRIVLGEEALFFFLFLGWAFVRSCNPAISGLEKFMDFGFQNAATRAVWMPPVDMWHAGAPINYYYFGHYLAGWLSRLTLTPPEVGYNLMLAYLFALTFQLPLSIAASLLARTSGRLRTALFAGVIAGALVSMGGNLHCFLYSHLLPLSKQMGIYRGEVKPYWYPDATRFIGYHPDNNDKTIHEFPSYSFVVADLHGHVSDIPNVLTGVALMTVLLIRRRRESPVPEPEGGDRKGDSPEAVFSPDRSGGRSDPGGLPERTEGLDWRIPFAGPGLASAIGRIPPALRGAEFLLLAPLLTVFLMTNTWNYPIYLTLAGSAIFLRCLLDGNDRFLRRIPGPRREEPSLPGEGETPEAFPAGPAAAPAGEGEDPLRILGRALLTAAVGGVCLAGLSQILAAPFLASFENITRGVGFVHSRTALWQLGVLWGYQTFFGAAFLGFLLFRSREAFPVPDGGGDPLPAEEGREAVPSGPGSAPFLARFLSQPREDLTVLLLFAAAVGLVLAPEIVYVRDIYEAGYHRANTMFKLTYQAFMLFALASGYAAIRVADEIRGVWTGALTRAVFGAVVAMPLIYVTWAVNGFYDLPDPKAYRRLDGLAFLREARPDDYEAVRWLRAHVKGQVPLLEAYGDSYTDAGRISMATGLPTIQGWYVHEWLWRGSPDEPRGREAEVRRVYEWSDPAAAKAVLRKYGIRYLVIGALEREKFPLLKKDPAREAALIALGRVVSDRPGTKLVEIDPDRVAP